MQNIQEQDKNTQELPAAIIYSGGKQRKSNKQRTLNGMEVGT